MGEWGGPYDGLLTTEEFIDVFTGIVPLLERNGITWVSKANPATLFTVQESQA